CGGVVVTGVHELVCPLLLGSPRFRRSFEKPRSHAAPKRRLRVLEQELRIPGRSACPLEDRPPLPVAKDGEHRGTDGDDKECDESNQWKRHPGSLDIDIADFA